MSTCEQLPAARSTDPTPLAVRLLRYDLKIWLDFALVLKPAPRQQAKVPE